MARYDNWLQPMGLFAIIFVLIVTVDAIDNSAVTWTVRGLCVLWLVVVLGRHRLRAR